MEENEEVIENEVTETPETAEEEAPVEDVAPDVAEDAPVDEAPAEVEETTDVDVSEDVPAGEGTYSEHDVMVLDTLRELGVNTVYLMGTSFILGVLFTVFVLLVLDFIRRNAEDEKKK